MSSLIHSITHNSPRFQRASVALVVLTSLAAFALRAGAQAPSKDKIYVSRFRPLTGTGDNVTRNDNALAAGLTVHFP